MELEVAPKLIDGTFFIPLQTEHSIGYKAEWDNEKSGVILTVGGIKTYFRFDTEIENVKEFDGE